MSERSNYAILGTCENCSHFDVCMYKEHRDEISSKIIERIDNCCCPSIFQFTSTCTQWTQRKSEVR